MNLTFKDKNGVNRCSWCQSTTEYIKYHDKEWATPSEKNYEIFEKLCLESFQSGLSWRTILVKRDNFREAFYNFDYNKIAQMTDVHNNKLLENKGIVRHKGKILATINNAKQAKVIEREFGSLKKYFWQFVSQSRPTNKVVSKSKESEILSKDLKKRGWKFVGATTVYSFMQAIAIVNDHAKACDFWEKTEIKRKKFVSKL